MHSGGHVSVCGGDDPKQKIWCLQTLLPFEFIQDLHLHRASGFSVSSKAHPSPLTPTLTCSWGWPSAIEEKHFFVLWTTNKPLQNCMHMSHTCLCNEQRAIWHSWYDPVQITTVKITLWPWHTWKSKFLWEFSQAEDNRAANPVHQPSTKTVGTSCAFLPSIPERCSSCLSLMNCHGNELATPCVATHAWQRTSAQILQLNH